VVETAVVPSPLAVLPPDSAVATAGPEPAYAARGAPPEPERPLPVGRRGIFLDVENTSHAPHLEHVLHRLEIDRARSRTDFVAVGNWRVIGADVARLLGRHGAQLVHSAPATGVRDWSDLRIAVTAGVWLATARPGDRIEIVSEDRAFDAVGDVAIALGIEFHRLSYRALSGAPAAAAVAEHAPAPRGGRRPSRGRRRGRGQAPLHVAPASPAPVERRPQAAAPAPAHGHAGEEPHTAPHDEVIHVVRELMARGHGRPVLIDRVARELKGRGFGRTPGSPRLITRLRRIKELSVSPSGMIALTDGAAAAESHARPTPPAPVAEPVDAERDEAAPAVDDDAEAAPTAPKPVGAGQAPGRRRSRRRRRGGRRAPA
jgi:hypothetical protein